MVAGVIHLPTDTYWNIFIFFENMDIMISIYGIKECMGEIKPLKRRVGGETLNDVLLGATVFQ